MSSSRRLSTSLVIVYLATVNALTCNVSPSMFCQDTAWDTFTLKASGMFVFRVQLLQWLHLHSEFVLRLGILRPLHALGG